MESKYKKALEEVLMNLRCIDTTKNKQVESYIDESIKIITNTLEVVKVERLIPEEVKNKVYQATQEIFKVEGMVETEKVREFLQEEFGICFFNTIELEKLIKGELDQQIFAYKDSKTAQEAPVQEQYKFVSSTSDGICTGESCERNC
ncbi:hypothetical protein [Clostridium beijerinckii]|uniref:hypothetical protein n=1 Tax=Clostridium beijerinckii TaxID=1520 RepID=UPI00232E71DB|nr:hypothetical protein [Clostridium beijerinckii]